MRMSGLLGKIDHFDPELENWSQYVERLEEFFEVNGIVWEKNSKRAVDLLVYYETKSLKVTKYFVTSETEQKMFEELADGLKNHYNLSPSDSDAAFPRSQKLDESLATYVAVLRHLAEFCNHGGSLDKMIRDKLVSGIND